MRHFAGSQTEFPIFRRTVILDITLDSIFYTIFYAATLNPESDFFVFYFVPLLTALLFLRLPGKLIVLGLTTAAVIVAVTIIWHISKDFPAAPPERWTWQTLIFHVILLRAFSFLVVLLPLTYLVSLSRLMRSLNIEITPARNEALIRAVPELIFCKNREEQFTFVSPKFCEFLKAEEDEIIGATDHDFFSKDDADGYVAADKVIFAGKELRLRKEESNTLIGPKGEKHERWVMVTKVPVYDAKHNIVEVLGAVLDMSVQKTRQLSMFGFFTHDFPKPLNHIRTKHLPNIVEHVNSTPHAPTYDKACEAQATILDCCNFLLVCGTAYGFLSDGSPSAWGNEKFPLGLPVDLVLKVLEPQHDNLTFKTEGVCVEQIVRSDLNKLAAIIYLLISNSATAVNKAIRSQELVPFPLERRQITISLRASDDRLHLCVDDMGCGIPDDEVPRLFSRFSGWGPTEHGLHMGYGLYIVKNFAEFGNGSVRLEQKTGPGARFHVLVACQISDTKT